jgi:hypothetical protein
VFTVGVNHDLVQRLRFQGNAAGYAHSVEDLLRAHMQNHGLRDFADSRSLIDDARIDTVAREFVREGHADGSGTQNKYVRVVIHAASVQSKRCYEKRYAPEQRVPPAEREPRALCHASN